MAKQSELLQKLFGTNGILPPELPLFPNNWGQTVSTESVIKTLESIAKKLNVPLLDDAPLEADVSRSPRVVKQ